MSQSRDGIENEVKLALRDVADGQRRLESLGVSVRKARTFEVNVLYDTPDGTLCNSGLALRLRKTDEGVLITYKGRATPGKHKAREEVETTVGNFDDLAKILGHLGYRQTFRYEKFRTEFETQDGEGVITLDETPIGVFLELEGPGEWIDRTARALGFEESCYILKSYTGLYFEACSRRGSAVSDMVFTRP